MPDNSLGYDLVWHRLGLHLQCVKAEGRKAHPISVLEAIVKGAHQASGLDEAGVRVMFRVPGTRVHQIRISRSRSLRVEILLFTDQTDLADRWLESAGRYFDPKSPGRNFRVVRQEIPEIESFSRLLEEHSAGPVIDSEAALPPDEICLDFLTPLPFEPTAGHPRTWIDKERLLKTMVDRLRRLPGGVPSSLLRLDPPTPIPAYWTYQQIEHDSKSQPGHPKYLNGCTGPLLLRGSELDRWLPWLRLFERIGLGKQVSFGQGQFRLWPRSVPVLDAALLDPNQISLSIEALIQRDPDLLLHAADGPDMLSREELAHRLVAELREGWKPGVFRRVQVQREGKGARKRVLEIPTARDRIVYAHLLRLLAAPMDCLFSTASIGYRKGKSRDDAVAQVRAAIAAGCTHVVESDIADFFPSVNLARLLRTLDDVLPHRDHRLRSTLEAAILMPPSGDSGESGLKPRTHGLPIGTALSPLLANLYLNAFDHELRAAWSGAHLIRYADDFIVLTQSEAIAQDLLQQAEAAASRLDLALNIDKTQIRALAEGFEFLGIRFSAESGSEEWLDERPTSLRKLLYVTEP